MAAEEIHPAPHADHEHPAPIASDEETMQGRRVHMRQLSINEQKQAIEDTFDYRGDVSLVLDDDSVITGFVFDRRWDSDDASGNATGIVRLILKETGKRETIPIGRIIGLAFTGRDPALGKSWQTWLRKCGESQG